MVDGETTPAAERCAWYGERGEHRIPDAFCSVGHAADWAKAGGRWR